MPAELKRLRLTKRADSARVAKAMDAIRADWQRWSGPNNEPWQPFAEAETTNLLAVDEISRRATYQVEDAPLPWYRRLLRFGRI